MALALRSRASWAICLAGIIAAGIASRVFHTGLLLLDKYLGDALYAAMVYAIIRIFWKAPARTIAVTAMLAMTVIELFQLTKIAAHLLSSQHLIVRICARLMGTEFSFVDLFTYAVGIACMFLADSTESSR